MIFNELSIRSGRIGSRLRRRTAMISPPAVCRHDAARDAAARYPPPGAGLAAACHACKSLPPACRNPGNPLPPAKSAAPHSRRMDF